MDYTTGSFGVPSDNNDFGRYMFGSQEPGNTIPPYSVAKEATMQYMYAPSNYSSPTMRYQSPTYATQSYGMKDSMIHTMLGKHHNPGINLLHHQQSKNEYQQIAKDSTAWDMAGIGASAATMLIPSLAIGIPASIAVDAVVGGMKEEYFDNYRLTQRVNRMTGGIRGKNGSYGLSGKENANIARFIKDESAKDIMLNQDDFEGILSIAQDSGLLNSTGSGEQFKSKALEMKNAIKDLMSALGSSNIKELMATMGEFSRMGVGTISGQKGMVKRLDMSARFAGIGKEEMHDQMMNAVANGDAVGIDSRISASNMMSIMTGMTMMQQGGQLSSKLLDKTTYASAAQKSDFAVGAFNETMSGGITTDLKIIYAGKKAKENGTTAQEELNKFSSMSISDQSNAFFKEMGQDRELADAYYFKNTAAVKARRVKGIGKDSTRAMDFAAAYDMSAQMTHKDASSDEVVNMFNMTKESREYLDANGMEVSMAQGKIYSAALKRSGGNRAYAIRQLQLGDNTAKQMQEIEDRYNESEKYKESKTLWSKAERGWNAVKNYVSQSIGGMDSAAESIDKSRRLYGAIYGTDKASTRENSLFGSISKIGSDRKKVDMMGTVVWQMEEDKIQSDTEKVMENTRRLHEGKKVLGPLAKRAKETFGILGDLFSGKNDPSKGMFGGDETERGPTQYTFDGLSIDDLKASTYSQELRKTINKKAGREVNAFEASGMVYDALGGGFDGVAGAVDVLARAGAGVASSALGVPYAMALTDKVTGSRIRTAYKKQRKNDWGAYQIQDETRRGSIRVASEESARSSGKDKRVGMYDDETSDLVLESLDRGEDTSTVQKSDGTIVTVNAESNKEINKLYNSGKIDKSISRKRAISLGKSGLEKNDKGMLIEKVQPYSQHYDQKTIEAGIAYVAQHTTTSKEEQGKVLTQIGIAEQDHDAIRKDEKATRYKEMSQADMTKLTAMNSKEDWELKKLVDSGEDIEGVTTGALVRGVKGGRYRGEEYTRIKKEILSRSDGGETAKTKEKLSDDEEEWLGKNKKTVSAYADLVNVNAKINKATDGKGIGSDNIGLLLGMSKEKATEFVDGMEGWTDKQKLELTDQLEKVKSTQSDDKISDDNVETLRKGINNDKIDVQEKFKKGVMNVTGMTSEQYTEWRKIGHDKNMSQSDREQAMTDHVFKSTGKYLSTEDIGDQLAKNKVFNDGNETKDGTSTMDVYNAAGGDSNLLLSDIVTNTGQIVEGIKNLG